MVLSASCTGIKRRNDLSVQFATYYYSSNNKHKFYGELKEPNIETTTFTTIH